MSNSTKRAIRTALQVVFGSLAGLALILPALGAGLALPALVAAGATVIGISSAASKVWALLEASGHVPLWLQDADDSASVVAKVNQAVPVAEVATVAPSRAG